MTASSQVKHRKMLQLLQKKKKRQRCVTKHDVKAKFTPKFRKKM